MKKRLTLVAAIVLLLTTVIIIPLSNVAREQEEDKTIYKSSLTIKEKGSAELNPEIVKTDKEGLDNYDSLDVVRVTVELAGTCLAEEFQKSSAKDIPTFLTTDAAHTAFEALQKEQESFINSLAEIIGEKNVSTVKTTSVVMNSVSFSCEYCKLEEIKKLENVKYAYVSATLAPCSETVVKELSEENIDSLNGDETDEQSEDDKNYSGAGTVIAVLDTGFDLDHDVLSISPENEKYGQDEFMDLIATLTQCTDGSFKQTELYNNQKVLFSYDYWDNDDDASTNTSSHGTMTAGVAAGTPENISVSSNAYDSQLLLMKCSSDISEDTDTLAILLAIEDSVKLGADVITIGYGNDEQLDTALSRSFDEMFNRVFMCGTAVVMPSGNFGRKSVAEEGEASRNIVGDGTVSSLSVLTGVLSVSEAEDNLVRENFFFCGGDRVIYNLPQLSDGSYDYSFRDMPDGEYDYVVFDGTRAKSDLNGTIAFIDGDCDMDEIDDQINSAQENGAEAVVIFGFVGDNSGKRKKLPCAFVTSTELSSLESTGTLEMSSEYIITSDNENAGKISDTASFGVNEALAISPDISEISPTYSSIPGNKYGTASGSSFASALAAGKIAVLKQYINSDRRFSEYTPAQRNSIVYSLMMSCTDIVTDNDSVEYIRLQGAGLVNTDKSLASAAFITVDGGLPKLELGSSEVGEYSSNFEITNISNEDVTFELSAVLMTEGIDEDGGSEHTEIPAADALVEFTVDGKTVSNVTVKAGEKVAAAVRIKINSVTVLERTAPYKNGTYLDGYLYASAEDGRFVTAPILGFIGDYNAMSAFDSFIYDEDEPITGNRSYLYLAENSAEVGNAAILGYNRFLKEYDGDNLSFNSNTFSQLTGESVTEVSLYIKSIATRNITDFKCLVKDEKGSVVFETEPVNRSRFSTDDELTAINTKLTSLSDGKYTITISGKVEELIGEYNEQSRTFNFTVDSKRPINTSYKTYYSDDKTYLEISGKDNNAIQGFDIYVAVFNGKTGKYEYSDSLFDLMSAADIPIYGDTIKLVEHHTTDKVTVFTYDITNLKSMLKRLAESYDNEGENLKISQSKVAFAAVDYAYNYSEIKLCDTVVYDDLTLEFTDEDGNPVKGVEVEVNKRSFTSDKNGRVTCANLSAGTYKVKLTNIPNNLCVEKNPLTITVGEGGDTPVKTVVLMPEGTYKSTSDENEAYSKAVSDITDHDPEQKPGKELNPSEPQPEDASSSIYAWIIVASLLAVSIVVFMISRKNFKQ